MAELKNGQNVKYLHRGKWQTGKVHGIRKVDTEIGQEVLSYLVDTGRKVTQFTDTRNEHGEVIDSTEYETDQPEQVDVRPGDIKPF